MGIEILIFEVDGQRFGIPPADVMHVVRTASLTPLPQAPEAIEGILNLRGRLVPVLNTRRLLGLPTREMRHTDHLIVVVTDGQFVTLRADRATNLACLVSDQTDTTSSGPQSHLIEFVAKTSGGLVHVLDPHQLLADEAVASIINSLAERTASEVTR